MPLYMDVHENLPDGATAADVANAHEADLATQEKYGVKYLKYWVDDKQGKAFCLVDAPDAETAARVHREAHGLVADRIFEVQEVDDTIVTVFEDKSAEAASRIKLFLTTKPTLQLKAWITKDMQGYDTRIDLSDAVKVDSLDVSLFNPAAVPFERSR